MNIKDAAEVIKDTVTMEQVLGFYGYQCKHGKMLCPFHKDKNESLKVYKNNSWYCFGCHKGGSVIDFVMEHENCSFKTAVKAIDSTYKLDLIKIENPLQFDVTQHLKRSIERLTGILLDEADIVGKILEIDMKEATQKMVRIRSKDKRTVTADEWIELLIVEDEMDYIEYKIERLNQIRDGVRAWQREKILEKVRTQ